MSHESPNASRRRSVSRFAGRHRRPNRWLRERAREMRNQPTPAEAALWQRLKRRQVDGFKFRRQHVLGDFIADFCCISARLCIELDGACHRDTRAYDAARDAWIREHQLRVLRFSNNDVLGRIVDVLSRIRVALNSA